MAVTIRHRAALTLIELIVVVAIIATLATITALYFPRFQEQEQVTRGADMLQGWLLIARQQARRDGVPTGVRVRTTDIVAPPQKPADPKGAVEVGTVVTITTIVPHELSAGQLIEVAGVAESRYNGVYSVLDVPSSTTFTYSSTVAGLPDSGGGLVVMLGRFQYVQQPGNFAQGQYLRRYNNDPRVAEFKYVDFTSLTAGTEVRDGDYIDIMGKVRRVNAPASATQLSLTPESADLPVDPIPDLGPDSSPNYRVIPQPRPIPGEPELQMPDSIAVDVVRSAGLPSRCVKCSRLFEVVFGPSGALVGEGSTSGNVIFWVRHYTPNIDGKTLITVQPRTGFIAAHPVDPNDPFRFTRDARSSGM